MEKYTDKELVILDDFVKVILPGIITADLAKNNGEQWPEVFTDYADSAYRLAVELLKKRDSLKVNPDHQNEPNWLLMN